MTAELGHDGENADLSEKTLRVSSAAAHIRGNQTVDTCAGGERKEHELPLQKVEPTVNPFGGTDSGWGPEVAVVARRDVTE